MLLCCNVHQLDEVFKHKSRVGFNRNGLRLLEVIIFVIPLSVKCCYCGFFKLTLASMAPLASYLSGSRSSCRSFFYQASFFFYFIESDSRCAFKQPPCLWLHMCQWESVVSYLTETCQSRLRAVSQTINKIIYSLCLSHLSQPHRQVKTR